MATPWWLAAAAPPLRAVRVDEPEVEIVGAGITGCSCALTLARSGVRVRVHDSREIAGGASGRNGGFALRGGAMAYDKAREWMGADRAAGYWRQTEAALDRLAELAGDSLTRAGSLRIAADDEEGEELRAEYEALRDDGFAAEWRDELDPPLAGRFTAAIFHPRDASLQPAKMVSGLCWD
jgi:glycine/D-amino acid oxidase-like deaminating enzyme